MAEAYVLTREDVMALKDIARAVRGNVRIPRFQVPDSISQAPEVYIAKTPAGGIPALSGAGTSGDIPGHALCQIYRIIDNDSGGTAPAAVSLWTADELKKTVYNLSSSTIAGNKWTPVMRDKFGDWLAILGTPGAPGTAVFDLNNFYWFPYSISDVPFGPGIYVPGRPVGNWQTSMTAVANKIYAYPIGPFPQGIALSGIGIGLITPGSAGARARVGIYYGGSVSTGVYQTGLGTPFGLQLDSGDIDASAYSASTTLWQGSNYSMGTFGGAPIPVPSSPTGINGIFWLLVRFNSVTTMPVILACSTNNMSNCYGGLLGMQVFTGEGVTPKSVFGFVVDQAYGSYGSGDPLTINSWTPIEGSQIVPMPYFDTGVFA